ncbi:MAG TPA: PilT/PilU family type 4a pilus ATPase [Thermoanaerobaculia bacterium]|nr:PilT/PilU family type 4a pilus ATPase [Thermoanaerobaculia bacterium]
MKTMTDPNDPIRDPELDRLVRELNSSEALPEEAVLDGVPPTLEGVLPKASERLLDIPAQAQVMEGEPLDRLLAEMVRQRASDLLLVAGLPPIFRIDGRLLRADSDVLEGDEISSMLQPHLGARARRDMEERGSADLSLRLAPGREVRTDEGPRSGGASPSSSWRFRVNLHRQGGQLAAAMRALPTDIPSLAGLNLPASFAELVRPNRGLVLVCGPTGSGKSSTLAALVAELNRTRSCHIITIEDPVEYEHRSAKAVVEHVEIGRDARSFPEALRASLRQDPDVILVGEMRDLETVATALTAAETGHLVLSTLHTNDAAQAVHRIVDVFPPAQQGQIRHQLALSLHAIVVQQLVPRCDGVGRVPAVELMLATYAVRHHIRSDNLQKLYNEITLGKRLGMISMEQSLADLVHMGRIDQDEARVRASHPDEFETLVRI